MKKIRFSHNYRKLNRVDLKAKLLLVFEVNLEDLSKEFLVYDTDNIYKLPKKGKYLLLLFDGGRGLFSTLRPAFPQSKIDYYKSSIGEVFEIVINSNS